MFHYHPRYCALQRIGDPVLRKEIAVLRAREIASIDATLEGDGRVADCAVISEAGDVTRVENGYGHRMLVLFHLAPTDAGTYHFDVDSVTLLFTPAHPQRVPTGAPAAA